MEQLAHKMSIKSKDELPGLFVIHGALKKMERFSSSEISFDDLTPELLLLWSRKALIEIEVPALENYITELEKNETVDVDLIDYYKVRVEDGKKEHAHVLQGMTEVQKLVKEAKVTAAQEKLKKEQEEYNLKNELW